MPNFRTWVSPHGYLPERWRQTERAGQAGSQMRQQHDLELQECRLTRPSLKMQRSHIIPSSGKQWFGANSMDQCPGLS